MTQLPPRLVGLVGPAGAGKTTAARHLSVVFNYRILNFADPLRVACSAIFGWSMEKLEGVTPEARDWRERPDPWWSKRLGIPDFSPRRALQTVGTELLRNGLSQDVLVAALERRLDPLTLTVVADVRMPNEASFVRSRGGVLVGIVRQTDTTGTRHPTETHWQEIVCDAVVVNDCTLAEFHRRVEHTVRSLSK